MTRRVGVFIHGKREHVIENADWRGRDENIVGWSSGEKRVQYCNVGQQSLPQVNTKIQIENFHYQTDLCPSYLESPTPVHTPTSSVSMQHI